MLNSCSEITPQAPVNIGAEMAPVSASHLSNGFWWS